MVLWLKQSELASCMSTGEPPREGLRGSERQPPICLLQWKTIFSIPPFPKKHTLQAEELARAGRERAAPTGLASWCVLPAWRKICHFCSTLHGGSLEFFQAKGKIIERQKQTRKFNPGTSRWCRWLGKNRAGGIAESKPTPVSTGIEPWKRFPWEFD